MTKQCVGFCGETLIFEFYNFSKKNKNLKVGSHLIYFVCYTHVNINQ